MDDTISRAAAIETMLKLQDEDIETYGTSIPEGFDGDRAVTALKALSPAQPGWIPVTERLPKKDGDYLVTTHSGQIARYIFIGGSSEEYWRRCATAWMPLPKPYREGEQDGET